MNLQINKSFLIKDILAGLTVSFTALSLGAAFGNMSGRGAVAGMISAAIIPIITSLFGGTRIQASGPTAPMTAITAVLVANAYDTMGLPHLMAEQFITLSIILSGLIMIVMGLLKFGKYITYVPNAVVLGFMNGIAFLIWYDQIAKVLGMNGKKIIGGGSIFNMAIALITLICIFGIPFLFKKYNILPKINHYISPILVSIIFMTLMGLIFGWGIEKIHISSEQSTLASFTHIIVRYFPTWDILTWEYLLKALPFAFQLAMLGYLDSLLTALIVDRMTKETTLQNKELVAQGVSNTLIGLLQGIPGAQATIRSVILIKEDAKTKMAGVFVGVFVLLCFFVFKDWVTLIPTAVFVGVLFKAGWDVCDRDYMKAYFKFHWYRSFNRNFQLFIITYTTVITLLFDLNIAVFSGTALFYCVKYVFKNKSLTDVEAELEENID